MTSVEDSLLTDTEAATTRVDTEFPRPPSFDDVADERAYRKQCLVDALHILGGLGFAEGAAGHITVRDPGHPDRFWVNPFGMAFTTVGVQDLLEVSHEGEVLTGNRPLNNAAFAIHGAIHAARPDVMAACHTHSMYGKTFSALGKPLDMISQDTCMFYEDHVVHSDDGGAIVTDLEAGHRLAASLASHKALIHQNHGIITVGETVDEAAWWFIALERACQSQLLADAAGTPKVIPHEFAKHTYEQSGYPFAGWFQFQTVRQEHGLARH